MLARSTEPVTRLSELVPDRHLAVKVLIAEGGDATHLVYLTSLSCPPAAVPRASGLNGAED